MEEGSCIRKRVLHLQREVGGSAKENAKVILLYDSQFAVCTVCGISKDTECKIKGPETCTLSALTRLANFTGQYA